MTDQVILVSLRLTSRDTSARGPSPVRNPFDSPLRRMPRPRVALLSIHADIARSHSRRIMYSAYCRNHTLCDPDCYFALTTTRARSEGEGGAKGKHFPQQGRAARQTSGRGRAAVACAPCLATGNQGSYKRNKIIFARARRKEESPVRGEYASLTWREGSVSLTNSDSDAVRQLSDSVVSCIDRFSCSVFIAFPFAAPCAVTHPRLCVATPVVATRNHAGGVSKPRRASRRIVFVPQHGYGCGQFVRALA